MPKNLRNNSEAHRYIYKSKNIFEEVSKTVRDQTVGTMTSI